MPNFTAGTSFTDGVTNDVTAAKLNALVADAVPTSSLSLNSTTGTIGLFSSGTGTAATPAIQPTGDTNTGIFFPAADTIAFSEGGAEAMRIDSSGNVGIGGTPSTLLHIQSTSPSLRIQAASGNSGALDFYRTASVNSGQIASESTNALVFSTNGVGNSGLAERLRIDSSGQVGVGTSSPRGRFDASSATLSGETGAQCIFPLSVTIGYGGSGYGTIGYNLDYRNATNNTTGVKYLINDTISQLDFFSGGFIFRNASVGTSGAAATLTERLRIDSSGNCSIGTATALSKLHVHGDLTLSNATTAVTASTSTITPPATVAGYLTVSINGTSRKIPYYAT